EINHAGRAARRGGVSTFRSVAALPGGRRHVAMVTPGPRSRNMPQHCPPLWTGLRRRHDLVVLVLIRPDPDWLVGNLWLVLRPAGIAYRPDAGAFRPGTRRPSRRVRRRHRVAARRCLVSSVPLVHRPARAGASAGMDCPGALARFVWPDDNRVVHRGVGG